jgi:hypothetical protein
MQTNELRVIKENIRYIKAKLRGTSSFSKKKKKRGTTRIKKNFNIYLSYCLSTNNLRFPRKESKVTLQEITSIQVRALLLKYQTVQSTKKKKKKTALSGLKLAIYKEIPGSTASKGLQSSM